MRGSSIEVGRPLRCGYGTMLRLALLLTAVGLASISCAHEVGGRIEGPVIRPVPDSEGLASWLGTDAAGDASSATIFIQMADPQLGFSSTPLWLSYFGRTGNDDDFEVDARLFETAIARANEVSPAFVVICGDLVNRVGHAGQIAEFRRIAGTLNSSIPLYLVAGNHDVENRPTAESLQAYRDVFGADWYSFREGDVYGIVLNSQLIDSRGEVPDQAEKQLGWLREELVRAGTSGAGHILIFQHHPYFLLDPLEKKQYFNIAPETRALYLELFERAGVEAVFAGHYHRNAHGRDGDLEMITSGPVGRPLGDDPSGLRIVKIEGESLEHEYFALESR